MLKKIKIEYEHFLSMPYNMRVLLITNMLYSLVLPVVEIFLAAYIMRFYNETIYVALFQLAMYTGIILTSITNGFLLKHFKIAHLYSFGILLSGLVMASMMQIEHLSVAQLFLAGLLIGAASWVSSGLIAICDIELYHGYQPELFLWIGVVFFTLSEHYRSLDCGAILAGIDGMR